MLSRPFIKTVESGAQTTIFCAVEVFICKVILNLCKSLDWFHQYHPDDFFPKAILNLCKSYDWFHQSSWRFLSRRVLVARLVDIIQTAGSIKEIFQQGCWPLIWLIMMKVMVWVQSWIQGDLGLGSGCKKRGRCQALADFWTDDSSLRESLNIKHISLP